MAYAKSSPMSRSNIPAKTQALPEEEAKDPQFAYTLAKGLEVLRF